MFRPETFGKYNPNLEWSQLHPRQQFQQDKVLLLEYLPDPTTLQQFKINVPAEDAISGALRQFVKDRKLPIHTIFAAQVFVDIHHELGARVAHGLKECKAELLKLRQRYLRTRSFTRISKYKTGQSKDFVLPRSRPVKSYHWLSAHPLLCGLRLFSLRLRIQELGILFICAWGTWWLAHLYNAAWQMYSTRFRNQILDIEWPDMDILIDMQGEGRIFVGSTPTTIDESWARLNLIIGYSAGSLIRQPNRRHGLQESARGPRRLSDTAPISRIFTDQLNKNIRADTTLHLVEKFFKLAAAKEFLPADKPSTSTGAVGSFYGPSTKRYSRI